MTIEEHKENEGRNLPGMMAVFTLHHGGEMLEFTTSSQNGCFPDENPLFPAFSSVELPFLGSTACGPGLGF